ncbi:MAG TPA: PAS domain S-box protein [Syntrophomonadaceae bacterium]|nr:PAS domain S-box protein [Syntrophomonadaceae bacterium]
MKESLAELKNLYKNSALPYQEAVVADIVSLHRLDEDLTILYVSPGVQNILGYAAEELIGTSLFDYIDINDRQRAGDMRQWLNPGSEYIAQLRCETSTHNWVLLEVKALLLPGNQNGPEVLLVSREIAPKRQSPETSMEDDVRYRAIVEDQTDLICRFLPSTRITFVNEAFCRYFQQSREQLIGSSCLNFLEENRETIMASLKSLTLDSPVITHEQKILAPNSETRWLQITVRAIFDDAMGFVEYQFVGHDITERKRAEIALRESQQRLADLINFLPDPTFAIDRKGRLITWNRAVEETTGVVAPDILGKGNYEYSYTFYGERKPILIDLVLNPDLDLAKYYHEYSIISKDQQNLVAEVYVPNWNGKRSYLWCIANPLYDTSGNMIGAIESVRDISDRKQTEKALKQSEQKYRTLFSTMNEGLALLEIILDDDGNPCDFSYLDVNPVFEKMVNRDRSQLIGKKIREVFGGDLYSLRIEQYSQVALTGKPVEFQWYEPNMDKHFDVIAFNPGEGQCAALFIDITKRQETEQALRLSEEKFSKAFSSSPNCIVLNTITDGCFIDVNDNFCFTMGYSRLEVIGKSSLELNLWQDPEDLRQLMKLLQQQGYVRNEELHLRSKANTEIIGLGSAELININNKVFLIGTMIDITERKQMEAEMARLDRLNLVGEIAASIGHEIRNPMTTVRGFLQMLGSEDTYLHDSGYFDLMIEEIDRANAIITEFLSLAKNKTVDSKVHNLNSILENVFPLLQADAVGQDKRVRLVLEGIPDLLLDEKEIRQLLFNLVRNGMDAMDTGGTVTIKTFVSNQQVVLAISDQGSGIAADVLKQLGTPFFTTKENGTGLGLSVCYSIAARHNASIQIETGPAGTTFYVNFPIIMLVN